MYEGMKNMAKTPMEMEEGMVPKPSDQSVYPYSLSITLEDDELEKLGLDCEDEECQVGNYLHLHALAEVTGINKRDTGDGQKTCLNIQITHLQIEDEGSENDEADEEMNGAV